MAGIRRAAPGNLAPRFSRRVTGTSVLVSLLFMLFNPALAQTWELRACASADNLPFSAREEPGFENRIAEIVAEELDAELSYEWIPAGAQDDHRWRLRRGDCDFAVGVADGAEGYLTTVVYYRSFPVFVYREDAPIRITSFDDEELADMKIGVLSGAGLRPEVAALANRSLMENVVSYPWMGDRPSPLAAPIEAVASGAVDVAVLWGPVGAYFAARQPIPLEVVAAEPKMDLPFLNLVVSTAMGVRPGDEALRDLLNEAIVARWNEIQEVLAEYRVPMEQLSPPAPSPAVSGEAPLRIGLVLPLPTGEIPLQADGPEQAAAFALKGAIMAEEDAGRLAPTAEPELLVGNAPSPAAARRTAGRLVAADGVQALLGGFDGQAGELASAAERLEVPFLNIGSSSRNGACNRFTFHVEPSVDMYLSALAGALADAGYRRWFVAFPDSAEGGALISSARAALEQEGASTRLVGEAAVADDSQFLEVLRSADQAQADVLVALLDWRAQLDLAGLVDAAGTRAMLTGLPVPMSQTRTFYYSLSRLTSPDTPTPLLRVTAWDAELSEAEAKELNERYFQRWGEAMDSPAWMAHTGVEIIHEAARSVESKQPSELAAFLRDPEVEFDVRKGGTARFDERGQLRQPLYLLRLESGTGSREDLVSVSGSIEPTGGAGAERVAPCE